MKKFIIIFCNITFLSLLLTLPTYGEAENTILLEPENPGPKTVVTLTLQSYTFNVDTSTITC